MTTVTSIAQLNAAIMSAAGVTASGTITLSNDIALGGARRGLFVDAGTVEINNLANNNLLAQGAVGCLAALASSDFGR